MQTNEGNILFFVFVTSIILVLLCLLVIGLLYLYKKKQAFYAQQFTTVQLQAEKHILSARIEVQEHTFQEISREIHDNISLSLTLAHLYLKTFQWGKEEQDKSRWEDATEILAGAISDLRDMSKGLSSGILHNEGLIFAVEHEINRIRKTGQLEIELMVSEDIAYLETSKELIIFRIIQEAFNNIIRHSRATRATIQLEFAPFFLYISIADNGVGFAIKDQPSGNTGTGLSNMRLRTEFIGGVFDLDSSEGKGTVITISVPV